MKLQCHIAGGLLLCVAALLLSAVLLPGETYSRYAENTASWNAMAHQEVLNQEAKALGIETPDWPVLSEQNRVLTIVLPVAPSVVDAEVNILSTNGDYVECTGQAPVAIVSDNMVRVYLGSTDTLAGTYQLELTWVDTASDTTDPTEVPTAEATATDENTNTVSTAVVTFFVNYSGF